MTRRGLVALAFALSVSPVFAATPSGYSSTLPDMLFAVSPAPGDEVEVGDWSASLLSVNSGVLATAANIVQGASCSPEGQFAYDMTNHMPVYCQQSGTWKKLGGTTFVSAWVGIPFGNVNLANYVPATASAIQISSCGPNGQIDGLQMGAYYSGGGQASCQTATVSMGTHNFAMYWGGGWFAISGYFL
jgi:hypothetical protein